MDHQELLELAAMLPLGTLDAEDERRLEDHLRGGCAECEAAIRAASNVVDALAASVQPMAPSPGSLARLMERAAAEGAAAPATRPAAAAGAGGARAAVRPAAPRRLRAALV